MSCLFLSFLFMVVFIKAVSPSKAQLFEYPGGGAIWGGLGGAALLERVCHWGWALRIVSLSLILVHSLCFMFTVKAILSQLPVPAAVPAV